MQMPETNAQPAEFVQLLVGFSIYQHPLKVVLSNQIRKNSPPQRKIPSHSTLKRLGSIVETFMRAES